MELINKTELQNGKLYNIGFHPIFFFLFPQLWLAALPFNFLMDSIVILIGLKIFVKTNIKINYKKVILKTWICGFISDLVATGLLFLFELLAGELLHGSILGNPFSGIVPFIGTLIPIAIAGFLIFILNYKVAFKKTEMSNSEKKKVAILLAIATAPYLFLMPVVF